MPIKPENRELYPGGSPTSPEWKAIRLRILERAGDRCEWCKAPNLKLILRSADGKEYAIEKEIGDGLLDTFSSEDGRALGVQMPWYAFDAADAMFVKVVLTVAHLDQDPTNNADENLAALCQRCHNRHDAPHRQKNAAKTRHAKKGMADMFGY